MNTARTFKLLVATATLVVGASWSISSAHAQTSSSQFQVERFEPLPSQGTNILNVAKSEVLPHATPSVGLFMHYMNDPLLLISQDGTGEQEEHKILEHSFKGEVWAAFGLWDLVDLGIVMPVVFYQSGDDLSVFGVQDQLSTSTVGDLRIIPKFQLMNAEDFGGFGAALLVPFSLPTGSELNTGGSVGLEPRLAVDYNANGFIMDFNIAYAFRDETVIQNHVSDDVVRWGVGVEAPLVGEDLQLLATLFGDVSLVNQRDPSNPTQETDERVDAPIETEIGLQYWFGDIVTQAGGGTGITKGVGSPDFRVFASVGYTPRTRDKDGDGIVDDEDQCPENPEDLDGFEDSDGCPDLDNDDDGIEDKSDGCPDDAEDKDGFEDENGCPDPDNDQDTVLDEEDECPIEAGLVALAGCPDDDNDLIINRLDKCPQKAEDIDGFEDDDGCPDEDNDGDLILDPQDKCPDEAEDKDGFEDLDGCPDFDNDKDGILDPDDKCPLEPETINGFEDEDGCPDKGKTKVRITKTKIEILDKVYFATGKSTIKQRSFNLLDQVASVLRTNPQITKIRVEGHTDSRGRDASNLKLSQKRADAVQKYLEDKKIDPARLEAVGYGETKPIADNKKSSGRDQNRRVEFTITAVNGKPVGEGPVIIEKKEAIEDDAKPSTDKPETEPKKTEDKKTEPKKSEPKKDAKP